MNDRLRDLLYAPIGLVAGASQVLPELAEQGRIQVANARVMGEMATRMGTRKASEQLASVHDRVHEVLVGFGIVPPPTAQDVGAEDVATRRRTGPATRSDRTADDAADTPPAAPSVSTAASAPPVAPAPEADTLAIVEYDSLAASQVVPRLAALDPEELEAVRRYELANRGRKTILGRVAQLQG